MMARAAAMPTMTTTTLAENQHGQDQNNQRVANAVARGGKHVIGANELTVHGQLFSAHDSARGIEEVQVGDEVAKQVEDGLGARSNLFAKGADVGHGTANHEEA